MPTSALSGRLIPLRVLTDSVVNGTGSVTSPAIDLSGFKRVEAIRFKASSVVGAAKVKVEYAISDKVDGEFTTFDDQDDLIVDSSLLTDPEAWHSVLMPIVPDKAIQFKVTGLATNPVDTLASLVLMARE